MGLAAFNRARRLKAKAEQKSKSGDKSISKMNKVELAEYVQAVKGIDVDLKKITRKRLLEIAE